MDVRMPDGTIVKNVPEDYGQAEVQSMLQKHDLTNKYANAAKDMSASERFIAGAGSTFPRTWHALKQMVGQTTPAEDADMAAQMEGLDTAGKLGGLVGDIGTSAIPAGGLALGAGKLLTKAVPAATALASYGGRVANLGTAGNMAVQGGTTAALQPTEGDESRLSNIAQGAIEAPIAGAAASGLGIAGRKLYDLIAPTKGAAERNAARVFKKTLGDEDLETAYKQAGQSSQGMLPTTTAALTENPKLGNMEAGARLRGNADFKSHDTDVAETAWNIFNQNAPGRMSRAFRPDYGPAITPRVVNNDTPILTAGPLRRAIASYGERRVKGVPTDLLSSSERANLEKLAEDLKAHEIYTPTERGGTHNVGGDEGLQAVGGAVLPWPVFRGIRTWMTGLNKKSAAAIDEMLLKPERFHEVLTKSHGSLTADELALRTKLEELARGVGSAQE